MLLRGEKAAAVRSFHAEIARTIGYETRSIVCTPARIADRTVGVLELLNLPEGEKPSRGKVEFLEKCACLCGLVASARY